MKPMPFTLESLRAARAILAWAVRHDYMGEGEAKYLTKSITRIERVLVSCSTKESYPNWHVADQVVQRTRQGARRAYRCSHCGGWHVGSFDPAKRRELKRQMREHLRAMRDDLEIA